MSGLLQRLAGQAMDAQASGAPRVRSATSVHAHVPLGLPLDADAPQPTLAHIADAPRAQAEDIHAATPGHRGLVREVTTVIQSVEAAGEPAAHVNLARPIEARGIPAPTSPETSDHRYASHDFVKLAPRPLLDEVQAASPAPAITPATQPAVALTAAPNYPQSEPTEVHVHIGRIEVIAATEPAAPKKYRTTPARNTLPLAEYLARRGRS